MRRWTASCRYLNDRRPCEERHSGANLCRSAPAGMPRLGPMTDVQPKPAKRTRADLERALRLLSRWGHRFPRRQAAMGRRRAARLGARYDRWAAKQGGPGLQSAAKRFKRHRRHSDDLGERTRLPVHVCPELRSTAPSPAGSRLTARLGRRTPGRAPTRLRPANSRGSASAGETQ